MHESGLAAAVADTLRKERLDGARVRLLVSGGHVDPFDFDAAFRFHLVAAAPDLAEVPLEIVHLPTDRLCVGCGRPFAAITADEPCPKCGSVGLPTEAGERVEIELVRPGATDP